MAQKAASTADLMLILERGHRFGQKEATRPLPVALEKRKSGKAGPNVRSSCPNTSLKADEACRPVSHLSVRSERDETDAMPAGHAVSWSALWRKGEKYPSYYEALAGCGGEI